MICQQILYHFFLPGVVQSPLYGAEELCDMDVRTLHTKELLHKPLGLEAQAWMCMCLRNQFKAKPGTKILPKSCIKSSPEMPGGVPGLSFFFVIG